MSLRLVLMEPAGPLNVGSVARLCANFGVTDLALVAPRCDPLGPEARLMAVHGLAVLEAAQVYPDLASALASCRRVVACTGRPEGEPLPLEPPEPALRWLRAGPDSEPCALVFGREDRGLSNDELLRAGRLLQIPAGTAYPSLNLSHAVAVVLQQWFGMGNSQGLPPSPRPLATAGITPDPAPQGQLEAALQDAEALLLEVGYLYPHTARARMAKVRALLQRAQASSAEVALLRGMVAQLRWASRRGTSPPPSAGVESSRGGPDRAASGSAADASAAGNAAQGEGSARTAAGMDAASSDRPHRHHPNPDGAASAL